MADSEHIDAALIESANFTSHDKPVRPRLTKESKAEAMDTILFAYDNMMLKFRADKEMLRLRQSVYYLAQEDPFLILQKRNPNALAAYKLNIERQDVRKRLLVALAIAEGVEF